MGMFAEKAIIVNRLSFANQGKQTSFFHFRLQQTAEVFYFPFAAKNWKLLIFR
jgi:hypothetical protein